MLVDGIARRQAWRAQGYGDTGGGQLRWWKLVEAHPALIERVRVLAAERETLMADDDPLSQALWQARTIYRVARAKDDLKAMVQGTQMQIDITDKMRNGGTPRPVGRPQTETPSAVSGERQSRTERLAAAGVPQPGAPK